VTHQDPSPPVRPAGSSDGPPAPRRRLLPSLSTLADLGNRYGLVLAWIVVIVIFSSMRPSTFPTTANFQNIFGSQAVLLILTTGLLVPLMAGEFDVSIGGVLSVSLVLTGYLNIVHGWPVGLTICVVLACGVLIGLVNALFVVGLGLNSFVVTLGTGTLLTGAGMGINNVTVSGISDPLVQAARHQALGLPLAFYYGLALVLVCWYVFTYMPVGRALYFVGAGQEVARLAGVSVHRIKAGSFVASAAIATFAGVILAGVLGGADPNTGASYLLPAFAAAFLGATAIVPGRFNPIGTFIAVYFLVTGITGLQIVGLSGWIEQVFYGGALVVAVAFSRLSRSRFAGATL
jgi:ribose transport system permease protein